MPMVEYRVDGPVALIRLDRPPVNALSGELAGELRDAFLQAGDDAIRAVVVTGEPHFAAGADIKGFQAAYEGKDDEKTARTLSEAIWALERLPKPTIAAVRGYALGGGLELAMGADFRFFGEDARVGQPEIKLGIIPGAGGTQRLPRLVGYQRAKEIVMTGRQVPASEALEMGLADEVHPVDSVLEAALAAARRWAQGPTRAYAAAKRSMSRGWGEPMARAVEIEAEEFERCFWTDDAREGVAAFVEKREAAFQGR